MIKPDILEQLRVYNESRDRMGDEADTLCVDAAEEITSLRAEVERWVKEVAHLKLSAEKADRERDDQVYMLGRILQFLS
jgi:hypothetical protein